MKVRLSSVIVDDQEKALRFYTGVLGFVKKNDIPMGDARWLTVVSPDAPDEVELLLEPGGNAAARAYQSALFAQGVPLTAFEVDDLRSEYERMKALGVVFRGDPQQIGPTAVVVFEDTCGNLIQLYHVK